MNEEGILALAAQKERSQLANKEQVVLRLQQMLIRALTPRRKRVKTLPTASSVEIRLQEKKMKAERKASRRKPDL